MKMKITMVLVSMLFLYGCGSGAPKCSDKDVQKTVIDIVKDKSIKQEIFNAVMLENFDDILKESEQVDPSVMGLLYGAIAQNNTFSLGIWEDYRNEFATVDLAFDMTGSKLLSINPKLTAIRTNSTDDEVKKCTCSASIGLAGGNSYEITYDAQATEDEGTYVNVYGL